MIKYIIKRFSKREDEVLHLIIIGLTSKEIASQLHINELTINTHRKRMMKKTHTNNIHGVVAFCIIHGILDIERLKQMMQ